MFFEVCIFCSPVSFTFVFESCFIFVGLFIKFVSVAVVSSSSVCLFSTSDTLQNGWCYWVVVTTYKLSSMSLKQHSCAVFSRSFAVNFMCIQPSTIPVFFCDLDFYLDLDGWQCRHAVCYVIFRPILYVPDGFFCGVCAG